VGDDPVMGHGLLRTAPRLTAEFRLEDHADSRACCVDQAQGGIATDHFGTRRPLGDGHDIGAHELR
jgi:hypothetical protein